jgi:CRISPR-associated endonuclease/helicase Cas3
VFRHKENDSVRPHGAKKQVIILPVVCKSDNGDFSFKGKTQFVYDPYVLCRTYEVFRDVSKIKMPSEIPFLIEKVYDERQETDKQMGRLHADLESRVRSMCGSAMASLATTLGSISDDRISTRLDERPKGMLLLLKRLRQHDDMVSLLLLNGETIELVKKDFGAHRKNIAKEIMRNCVSIELSMIKKSIYLTLFSQYVYVGDIMEHDFHPLFGYGIVASNHEIHDENNTLMGTYDEHLGFVTGVQKKQE